MEQLHRQCSHLKDTVDRMKKDIEPVLTENERLRKDLDTTTHKVNFPPPPYATNFNNTYGTV